MKRADMETTVGDRVTEGRLREASASLCRKATLLRVPLKALCEWAEADRAHQPDRKIIRQTYQKTSTGSKGPLHSGKGGDPNDTQIPTAAF